MRGMNSQSVDLIYLDPPFNSNANYAAPIGSQAAGAEFKDTWGLDDLKVAWHALIQHEHPDLYQYLKAVLTMHSKSAMAYLIYMAVRLLEMKRLLKPTGAIYLHCDPTMSHYLKLLLDTIFGRRNFRNEIVWCYSRPSAPNQKQLSRVHDIVLWYSVDSDWTFNGDCIRQPYAKSSLSREGYSAKASKVADGNVELHRGGKFPESWIYIPVLKGNSKEATGFPTQKPVKLLERIMKASTNEDDVVLDPFCGCATACIVAEMLGRQWVGIDISPKAADLVKLRMHKEVGLFYQGQHRTDIPMRTDMEPLRRYNHPENKKKLYGDQGGDCAGCQEHFEPRHLEIDHIVPRSKSGADHMENLQLLCGSCNRIKGNRTQEYLLSALNHADLIKLVA